jgi:Ca-activated chloride channel family protein
MNEFSNLHHFGFVSPNSLWGLLVIPLLFLFAVVVRRRRSRYTVAFTSIDVLAGVVEERRPQWRRGIPLILLALALSTAVAAVARPRIRVIASDQSATIVLLVDVSGSMQATDVTPSRIAAAVASMHLFLDKLPASDKVGLVAFSDRTEIIDSPTTDRAAVGAGLDVLSPEAGTALGDGVAAAVKMIVSSLGAAGVHHQVGEFLPAAIVLESDGSQNRGKLTPFEAANLAKEAGIRIYGVALGTLGGEVTEGTGLLQQTIPVPPNPGTVALLARTSGGKAFSATTAGSLNSIYRGLGSTVGRHSEAKEITAWFELIAAILLVAGIGTARAWGSSLP